jgi:hypothetical protein
MQCTYLVEEKPYFQAYFGCHCDVRLFNDEVGDFASRLNITSTSCGPLRLRKPGLALIEPLC